MATHREFVNKIKSTHARNKKPNRFPFHKTRKFCERVPAFFKFGDFIGFEISGWHCTHYQKTTIKFLRYKKRTSDWIGIKCNISIRCTVIHQDIWHKYTIGTQQWDLWTLNWSDIEFLESQHPLQTSDCWV